MRNSVALDRWRQDRGAPSWQRGRPVRESTALLPWQWRANRGRKCLQPQRQSAPAQRRCTSTAWERMGSHRSPSSISQQLATIAAIVLLLLGTGICWYRLRLCRTYKGRSPASAACATTSRPSPSAPLSGSKLLLFWTNCIDGEGGPVQTCAGPPFVLLLG